LTERMELYVGVAVALMFLAGCFLVIVRVRERFEERRRQGGWAVARPPATRRKQAIYEPKWKSRTNS